MRLTNRIRLMMILISRMWRGCTPTIPAFRKQDDYIFLGQSSLHIKFYASQYYTARSCLSKHQPSNKRILNDCLLQQS